MSLLTEVKGWTPVIDALTKEFGLVTSAVYGVVWRYCQGENRVCSASLETISDHIGVDRATVMRHIKKLCQAGYLIDLTPDLRNVPHTYADTGKAKILNLIEAQTVAECNTLKGRKKSVAEDNATVAQCNVTVAESHLKRESKIDSKRGGQPPVEIDKAIAEVCKINTKLIMNGQLKELQEVARLLGEAGKTPAQVRAFGEWWYKNDWRGRKGEAPKPRQICECWGQYEQGNGSTIQLTPEERTTFEALR